MRVAMSLAAKMCEPLPRCAHHRSLMRCRYNSHNTKERLSELNAKKLTTHVPDKEQRKTVVNAVKGIASGKASLKH